MHLRMYSLKRPSSHLHYPYCLTRHATPVYPARSPNSRPCGLPSYNTTYWACLLNCRDASTRIARLKDQPAMSAGSLTLLDRKPLEGTYLLLIPYLPLKRARIRVDHPTTHTYLSLLVATCLLTDCINTLYHDHPSGIGRFTTAP